MNCNLKTIKRNLYMLFWKYPELKNKNYNYLYIKYCLEFHNIEISKFRRTINHIDELTTIFENMPAMESISRCKRKLAIKDDLFRADSKKVIEARLKQSKEILESIKD